jgi:streptomycin 6-kinase
MLARVQITIPAALSTNVLATWPEAGPGFLAELPVLLDTLAERWDLTLGDAYPLSFHWVARATRSDGTAAVLKVGVPAGHLDREAHALRWWDGRGAVRLLAHDPDRGALLLERADPGTRARALVPHDDAGATAALISAGRSLHRIAPDDGVLTPIEEKGVSFRAHLARFPGDDPLPRYLVERAGRLFDELCSDAPVRSMLHGDLHHDNVLRAEREPWLAIDPKGVTGDPAFDCGAMLYNPDPWIRDDDLLRLVPARIEQLADGFGIGIERVVAWGFVVAMLSEVWTVEDGGEATGRPLDVATQLWPRLS